MASAEGTDGAGGGGTDSSSKGASSSSTETKGGSSDSSSSKSDDSPAGGSGAGSSGSTGSSGGTGSSGSTGTSGSGAGGNDDESGSATDPDDDTDTDTDTAGSGTSGSTGTGTSTGSTGSETGTDATDPGAGSGTPETETQTPPAEEPTTAPTTTAEEPPATTEAKTVKDTTAAVKDSPTTEVAARTDTDTADAADTGTESQVQTMALTTTAAAAATVPGPDWGWPLPEYPDVAGYTKTEVAAVAFVALAGATVSSLAVNPLLAIPLALMTLTAFGRLVELGTNQLASVKGYSYSSTLLGITTGELDVENPDGDTLVYTVSQQPDQGIVVMVGNTFVYTPTNLFNRPASTQTFTVSIDDSLGIRDHFIAPDGHVTTYTVTINVPASGANQLPVFSQPVTVTETNTETGVIKGTFAAYDPEGGPLTFSGVALLGSVSIGEDNASFTYTPYDPHAASAVGEVLGVSDLITITATDEDGLFAISTKVINVVATINEPPTATYENTGGSSLLGTVTGHIIVTDPDDTFHVFTPLLPFTTTKGGLVTVLPTGDYVYTAALSARQAASQPDATADAKIDKFFVTVDDLHGGTVSVEVTVSIPTINLDPIGVMGNVIPDSDGVVRGKASATDPDGPDNALTYSLAGGATTAYTSGGGIVHVEADGSYVYIPKVNKVTVLGITSDVPYADSFNITVTDANGGSSTIFVPLLTSLKVNTTVGSPSGGVVNGSVGFDKADNNAAFSLSASTPGKGTVVFNANGTFTYTATTATAGQTDSFDVTGTAYGLTLDLGTVTVTPIPPNKAPTADLLDVGFGDSTGIVTGGVNGHDDDGDTLSYSVTEGGASSVKTGNGAIIQVDANGNWAYIPPTSGGFLGVINDTFTVYTSDGRGGVATTTVNVTTKPLDIDYSASVSNGTVTGGLSLSADALALLTFGKGSNPARGTVTVNPNGTYTFTNVSNTAGQKDSFDIIATNAFGVSMVVKTVEVTPVPPNKVPTADLVNLGVGDSIGVAKGNVNGHDDDGDTLTYSVTGAGGAASTKTGNGAIIQVDANGNWTYIPPTSGGFLGVINDTFTVYTSDGRGGVAETTVNVTTKPLDIDSYVNVGATSVTGGLSIPSGDTGLLTYSVSNAPAGLTFNANGTFTYTGTASTTINIVGTNAYGQSMTVKSITVTPNQKPTITYTGLKTSTVGGGQKERQWTGVTVSDPEGQDVTVSIVSSSGGSASVSGPTLGLYTLLYRSNGGSYFSNGPSGSFVVRVTDSLGAYNDYTFTYP